jgi:hypothetical protein
MNDKLKEALTIYVGDIESLKNKVNEGTIDVYQFYEEVVYLNEFFKNELS